MSDNGSHIRQARPRAVLVHHGDGRALLTGSWRLSAIATDARLHAGERSLAQDALHADETSLEHLAEEIGYESASAFSTAFPKRLGCPPRAFGRAVNRSRQFEPARAAKRVNGLTPLR
jgi:AraC-like DNA-binding protein